MRWRLSLLVVALLGGGCDSPEASRTRGGGAGADVGNRPADDVQMHEGSNPFWGTPGHIPVDGPPLDTARQAQQFSR